MVVAQNTIHVKKTLMTLVFLKYYTSKKCKSTATISAVTGSCESMPRKNSRIIVTAPAITYSGFRKSALKDAGIIVFFSELIIQN
jgi:hypothetical protein